MTTGTHRDVRFPRRIPRLLRSHANMYSANIILMGLRIAQFTLAFVVLGLSAYVANWYNADTMSPPPAQIGWLLFVSLFTIISVGLLEGLPRFAPRFFHPYAALSLEFSNALFYFAGFIALSTFMSKLLFCRGSVCSSARADVAFGIFEFLLWIASTALASRDLFKKGFRRSNNTQLPLGISPMKEAPAP
ncbi:membrane-associating domain-containing protein [Xylaria sp. FL1777]|nr:membrane-associating domain-containing protein [Xylaria sp. FL1777]